MKRIVRFKGCGEKNVLRSENGFTLIEIISIIVLLGILAAVALPRFNTGTLDVNSAAQIVRSDLRFLQRLAMGQNTVTMSINFAAGANAYNTFDTAGTIVNRTLPQNITIVATKTLGYNKFGEPANAIPTDSIDITNGAQTKTIAVEQFTGMITIS